jgi:hypothetical protein
MRLTARDWAGPTDCRDQDLATTRMRLQQLIGGACQLGQCNKAVGTGGTGQIVREPMHRRDAVGRCRLVAPADESGQKFRTLFGKTGAITRMQECNGIGHLGCAWGRLRGMPAKGVEPPTYRLQGGCSTN